jgi:predicted nucleic acid-binding Zn ribbon protein
MNQVLQWPCAYDNCAEMLNDVDHTINRKYCDQHQRIRIKEQNKLKCSKYYKNNRRQNHKRCCVICGAKLKTATKYCGESCHKWSKQNNRQKKKMIGLCHTCYSSNISLMISNGATICKTCFESQIQNYNSKL